MALWSGRFEKGVSEFTQEFGASLPVDKAMYHQDIAGSRAHARMLAAQGVISQEDADAIVAGLSDIETSEMQVLVFIRAVLVMTRSLPTLVFMQKCSQKI